MDLTFLYGHPFIVEGFNHFLIGFLLLWGGHLILLMFFLPIINNHLFLIIIIIKKKVGGSTRVLDFFLKIKNLK